MKKIEQMRSWYNREYIEIVRRQKREAYLFLGCGWFFVFLAMMAIIDLFNLYGLITIPTLIISDLLQDFGLVRDLFILISTVWIAAWIIIWFIAPVIFLLNRSIIILDKEFVGDPERTEKWRKKRGKKDD